MTVHTYADANGRVINVLCPWSSGSGMVPPPTITFSGTVFAYVTSEFGTPDGPYVAAT